MKRTDATRIDGKRSGATRLPDGSIEIAPMWSDLSGKIIDDDVAIRSLVEVVLDYARRAYTDIAARRSRMWMELGDDLGLPLTEPGWVLQRNRLIPPKTKDPAPDKEG